MKFLGSRASKSRALYASGVAESVQASVSPPKNERTKLQNLFMIYSSMKNQQMSLVAFSFQRNSSLKEKSSAKSLTIDPSRRRVQQKG